MMIDTPVIGVGQGENDIREYVEIFEMAEQEVQENLLSTVRDSVAKSPDVFQSLLCHYNQCFMLGDDVVGVCEKVIDDWNGGDVNREDRIMLTLVIYQFSDMSSELTE